MRDFSFLSNRYRFSFFSLFPSFSLLLALSPHRYLFPPPTLSSLFFSSSDSYIMEAIVELEKTWCNCRRREIQNGDFDTPWKSDLIWCPPFWLFVCLWRIPIDVLIVLHGFPFDLCFTPPLLFLSFVAYLSIRGFLPNFDFSIIFPSLLLLFIFFSINQKLFFYF